MPCDCDFRGTGHVEGELTTVALIRAITTVVVTIAEPHFLNATVIVALELVGLAKTPCGAVQLIRAVTTVGFTVADVLLLDALVGAAELLAGLADAWAVWECLLERLWSI